MSVVSEVVEAGLKLGELTSKHELPEELAASLNLSREAFSTSMANLSCFSNATDQAQAFEHFFTGSPASIYGCPEEVDFREAKTTSKTSVSSELIDPLRTLIRLPGYGSDPEIALKMERIIAESKIAVVEGVITSRAALEQNIASRYGSEVLNDEVKPRAWNAPRLYICLQLAAKNKPYEENLAKFVHEQPVRIPNKFRGDTEQVSGRVTSAIIDGKFYNFTHIKEEISGNRTYYRNGIPCSEQQRTSITIDLAFDEKALVAANKRSSELFDQLIANRNAPKSPEYIQSVLRKVAEIEWLNAQTWKYNRGSSGTSALEARILLDLAGVITGRLKEGVDPNLEALSSTLDDFKNNYAALFETPPH
jgi:hypothetical protein